jgi:hypothetical protein
LTTPRRTPSRFRLTSRLRFARNHREWRRIAANLAKTTERASWWSVFNQPLPLLLLSAVVFGTWSTYHSAAQQCHEQADKIYTDLVPLLDELSGRFKQINDKIWAPYPDLIAGYLTTKHDADIEKIYRGEIGVQSPIYKNQSMNVILFSYNSFARYITGEPFKKIIAAGNIITPDFTHAVHNMQNDLTMYLYTIGALDGGSRLSSSPFPNVYTFIASDIADIDQRRLLLRVGKKIKYCSIFMPNICETLLSGYSDKPKLDLSFEPLLPPILPNTN